MADNELGAVSQGNEPDFDGWLGEDELPIHWQDYVSCNPSILVGKPTITGTRISVDLVLELLASGWSVETILESYPHLTRDQIRACITYALQLVREKQRASRSAAAR